MYNKHEELSHDNVNILVAKGRLDFFPHTKKPPKYLNVRLH